MNGIYDLTETLRKQKAIDTVRHGTSYPGELPVFLFGGSSV